MYNIYLFILSNNADELTRIDGRIGSLFDTLICVTAITCLFVRILLTHHIRFSLIIQ